MKTISKLGIGPMSPEIIEAVFRYSEKNEEPLMLIATQNQIDWKGGYVNNWTTRQYMEYVKEVTGKYPEAKVYVCRDHCGPGFKTDTLGDVYQTIDNDIENGFNLVHIDFCRLKGTYSDILEESKKAIEYIQKKNPNVLIEVGTDDNTGAFLNDISKMEKEMKFFTSFTDIQYFVCQTGSLIKEINQIGSFNVEFIKKVKEAADKYSLGLKEHNADYLSATEVRERKGLIDALNVAPQYGVIQTCLTLQKCLTYGIDSSEFLEHSYESKRWQKWLHNNSAQNKLLCSVIAGHYNFASDAYKRIYEVVNRHEDFKETIIQTMMSNFKTYIENL